MDNAHLMAALCIAALAGDGDQVNRLLEDGYDVLEVDVRDRERQRLAN
jgi:hypothetical protein